MAKRSVVFGFLAVLAITACSKKDLPAPWKDLGLPLDGVDLTDGTNDRQLIGSIKADDPRARWTTLAEKVSHALASHGYLDLGAAEGDAPIARLPHLAHVWHRTKDDKAGLKVEVIALDDRVRLLLARVDDAAHEVKKLGFEDFWSVAGVSRADTPDTIAGKWGKPDQTTKDDGAVKLQYGRYGRYGRGPNVRFRRDKALQLDFSYSEKDPAFVNAHPGPPLSLLGMPCDAAAARLAFTDKIDKYTTCKHYDSNGWLVDVTLTCIDSRVFDLDVVWVPLGEQTGEAYPPDHCGDLPK